MMTRAPRIAFANLPHRFDALHHRHPEIEQRHVGTMTLVRVNRLEAVAGLGDHVQVCLLVDDVGDAGPEQGMIVHEQHARGSWRRRDVSLRHRTWVGNDGGSQASTTSVPSRGAVTIVSEAPIRSARSCMLVMPKPLSRLPRDPAAIVGHRQAEADGVSAGCANGDPLRARMTGRVSQRFLGDRR